MTNCMKQLRWDSNLHPSLQKNTLKQDSQSFKSSCLGVLLTTITLHCYPYSLILSYETRNSLHIRMHIVQPHQLNNTHFLQKLILVIACKSKWTHWPDCQFSNDLFDPPSFFIWLWGSKSGYPWWRLTIKGYPKGHTLISTFQCGPIRIQCHKHVLA